ncbi:TPA: DNA repair protein RecO [Candidatus Delongbacteria bacterium]|nr:MAG: DNA repair protein RecO [Candidatus Delongbacteria bacterium GWF2_40_14]HAQ61189.1 DNA repair protein RecO [Candidatus Delongbacteria bacterium]
MKEYIKTTGIILDNSCVKENTAVITVLTPDSGVISFAKHGYYSKRNIYKSLLQPINLIDIHMEKHKGKFKFIEGSLIESFDNIRKEYNKTAAVLSIFSSLTNSEIYDQKDYNLIYTLIMKFLRSVNEKDPCLLTISIYFFFQLVWCLGISFTFDNSKSEDYRYLDIENGTFYRNAADYESENHIAVSEKLFRVMKNFKNIRFADIDKLDYITVNEYNEFRNMYKRYTAYHFNKAIIIQPSIISEAG